MNLPHAVRSGNSGPVFEGNAGDVLTSTGDGKAVFAVGSSGAQVLVTATTAATALDYEHGGPNDGPVRSYHVKLDASTALAITWPTLPRVVILRLIQGPGGNFVPTFGAEVKFSGSVTPTWSTIAAHWDELAIDWDGVTATVSYGTDYGP